MNTIDLFWGSFPEECPDEIEEADIYSANLDDMEINEREKGFMIGYLSS